MKVLGLLPVTSQDGEIRPIHAHSARAREDVIVVELSEEAFLEAIQHNSSYPSRGGEPSGSVSPATNVSNQLLQPQPSADSQSRSRLVMQGLGELESDFRVSDLETRRLRALGLLY